MHIEYRLTGSAIDPLPARPIFPAHAPARGSTARRHVLSLAIAAPALLAACLVHATKSDAADAAAGKALALQWCAACHLVADDQPRQSDANLPAFRDIAARDGFSEAALAAFLGDPHPKMPAMSLGNREIGDLARYIASLAP